MTSTSEFNKEIGAFLREKRNKLNYSGEFAGDYVGLERQSIYRQESGASEISFPILLRLLSLYKSNMNELIAACPTVKKYTVRGPLDL